MILFLLLGFVMGAAVVGGAAWWWQRRKQHLLRQVTEQLAATDVFTLDRRLPEPQNAGEATQLASSINQLLDRLQSAFESQRNFVVNASHKLRTPLTIITGQLEVNLIKPRSVAEHEQMCRSVLQDISRLNQLSTDLLELAQISADGHQVTLQPVALDEVIYQAGLKLKARRPTYQVWFEFDPRLDELPGPLTVPGDPDLLEQACLHLLENACKFSPDQQVQVMLSLPEQQALLQFQDHGSGIPPTDLPRIFEPFYRGSNARQTPGHGLGLALVQRIVQLHQGTVRVASAPGSGTTVIVRLPLAR